MKHIRKVLGALAAGAVVYLLTTIDPRIKPENTIDINQDGIEDLVEITPGMGVRGTALSIYDGATSTQAEDGTYSPGKLLVREGISTHRSESGRPLQYVFTKTDKGFDLRVIEPTPDFPVSITRGEYAGIVPLLKKK